MVEDMTVRGFGEKTRNDYIRHVRSFAAFIGRSPDTATAEDLRRFQLKQTEDGVGVPTHQHRGLGAALPVHDHARPAGPRRGGSPSCASRADCPRC